VVRNDSNFRRLLYSPTASNAALYNTYVHLTAALIPPTETLGLPSIHEPQGSVAILIPKPDLQGTVTERTCGPHLPRFACLREIVLPFYGVRRRADGDPSKAVCPTRYWVELLT